MKIGIIGGGLAGLSLGYHLGDLDFYILEKERNAGGLLHSERINGYTFDTGGSHILFSKDKNILNEMINITGDFIKHHRRTFIYYNGEFVKYPFENGIYMLSVQERYEILLDFVNNLIKKKTPPRNLLDWLYYVFGKKITEKYLKPYNEKIWKRNLEEISLEWVGNRVPNPPIEDILKSAVGIPTEGYLHQVEFYYPRSGGIESFAEGIEKKIEKRIKKGEEVKKIKLEDGKIVVLGKNEHVFDSIISTIPMNKIPRIIDENGEIEKIAGRLDYNSVTVVGLGVRGKTPDFHWVYVPQDNIIFHRIAFLHNYSRSMAPESRANILVEISHRPNEKLKNPVDSVMEGLEKMGINVELETCGIWERKYAYIIYNMDYLNCTNKMRKFMGSRGIIPFGRFGNWEYLNMDAIWKRAKETAKKLREEL